MPRFPLIVFDMDGVLVDSTGCHALAYEELWAAIGLKDGPPYSEIAGVRTVQAVRQYTAALRPSETQLAQWVEFKQQRARSCLQHLTPFPDVIPSLERLKAAGSRFAVGTGASRITTDLLLGKAGLMQYFPITVTADDVSRGKPDPETFLRAIQRSGGDPGDSLVVEDSAAGLAAGAGAGAATASVRLGETIAHSAFLGAFPDLVELTDRLLRPAA